MLEIILKLAELIQNIISNYEYVKDLNIKYEELLFIFGHPK